MKKPEILRLIRLNFFKLLGAAIGLVPKLLANGSATGCTGETSVCN